MSMWSWNFNTT